MKSEPSKPGERFTVAHARTILRMADASRLLQATNGFTLRRALREVCKRFCNPPLTEAEFLALFAAVKEVRRALAKRNRNN